MKIDKVFEYDISNELAANIQELLNASFPEIYPKNRIYFKQLPHFRFLAFNRENQLIGQVGLDYRVMNLNGKPLRILGVIDLCVSQNTRSQGVASTLLIEIDKFSVGRNIDFILLFADNRTLYLRNGYKLVKNQCKWLKIDNETQITNGIGFEAIDELMIKEVGKIDWSEGDLDFLGYLY
ncbi:GNAT family N-acetyltransferase [Paenibacillus sp. V4I5]|uniref:GNAT family N-acetyltransferase n=1 Tax=Paenibacillus sp. V4I5 TaxID=3042306 RepID=UPI0027930CC5|nr:GNAT family N-acetyltransferase [Paenibacillus sp. V4I5]MDQ0914643.1 putative acetyltransferase [Paenibacillus sp. V4I5]